jgi:hypothetical protein
MTGLGGKELNHPSLARFQPTDLNSPEFTHISVVKEHRKN